MKVTALEFASNLAAGEPDSPARFAAKHIERTLAHLDKVDVGGLVSGYLELLGLSLGSDWLDDEPLGDEILRITTLVETVLDEARKTVRLRMALDVVSNLLPRLTPKEH